jgi:hypothetical protein
VNDARQAADVAAALRMLETAIILLQLSAVATACAVAYAIWKWHRNRWK